VRAVRGAQVVRIPRDARAEQHAAQRLARTGLQRGSAQHEYTFYNDDVQWLRFVAEDLPALRAEGWQVEIDPDFRFRLAELGDWYAEVEEAGSDWFDLDLGVEVEGERMELLPILLEAVRERPDLLTATKASSADAGPQTLFVALPDGRFAPVPIARVRPVLSILHELLSLPDSGRVRLPRLDAARLADLEAATGLVWSGGEKLRELGARLASFQQVTPVAPPAGLQAALRPYQAQGLAWLQFLREYGLNGVLADDMGLGKTVQALAHILVEKEAGRLTGPALVVCPTSLVPNWKAEAARFAPALRVHVSHGQKRKDAFAQIAASDLVITTYPLLARDRQALLEQPFHLAILDEAQQVKNAQTIAAKVVTQLRSNHRLCLTGTPLENHLGELWSLFQFLMPGFLGDAKTFRALYRTPIEKQGDDLRRASLARRVRPFMLRRTKEQVARELPAKTEIAVPVEIQGGQRDLYETVRASMDDRVRREIAARGLQQSQIVVLDALLKLRQICCDPRLLKLQSARAVKESAKLDALMELLDELLGGGHKVLLFSQFTSMLELIEKELTDRAIGYAKLTGETRDREKPVKAFQSGAVPLFLISLKAGGTGLNLTAADTVVHYDPWWNPAVENQATDRAHRIGQDRPVFVYKLIVSGSVEEKIARLQASKAALARGVLGEGGEGGAALTAKDIESLFEPLG
jgi:SNF2 family DNA or RNA helicase